MADKSCRLLWKLLCSHYTQFPFAVHTIQDSYGVDIQRIGFVIELPEECPRGRSDCHPLSQIVSDEKPRSFICCGHNDGSTRELPQDRFRLCWKNQMIDEIGDWDERDIKDTISVLSQALSIDENIKLNDAS